MSAEVESNPELPTILDWVCQRYPDSPRKRVKEWFANGRVRIDDRTVYRMQERIGDPGERLSVVARSASSGLASNNLYLPNRLRIVYIDDVVAVLNKPAGMLSVPSADRKGTSTLDVLQDYLKRGNNPQRTALPVHRLDEYTSGLICFALNPEARENLIEQVKSHKLERTYLAYVEGRLPARRGTWRHAFKLDADGFRQTVVPVGTIDAAEAVTHYEVVKSFVVDRGPKQAPMTITKLRLRLQTGLKHQIRLQAATEAVPLLGDRSYHPDFQTRRHYAKSSRSHPTPANHPSRQALHAVRLGMIHPASGDYQSWQANLPKELAEFEAGLSSAEA